MSILIKQHPSIPYSELYFFSELIDFFVQHPYINTVTFRIFLFLSFCLMNTAWEPGRKFIRENNKYDLQNASEEEHTDPGQTLTLSHLMNISICPLQFHCHFLATEH